MYDFNFKIYIADFDFDISMFENGFQNRYVKAKVLKELPDCKIKYENAQKLSKKISIHKNMYYGCIVSGSFIFGDLIEALIVDNNLFCQQLTISTLSMDQNNVDSLSNLIIGGYCNDVNLIISDYFYAHERKSLIPYIYNKLDVDNKFQLAVAGSHTKIVLIKSDNLKIVIHGSANLRSSSNLEQFVIEENELLFDSWIEYHNSIINEYSTINKSINKKSLRGKKLWQVVQAKEAAVQK